MQSWLTCRDLMVKVRSATCMSETYLKHFQLVANETKSKRHSRSWSGYVGGPWLTGFVADLPSCRLTRQPQ